MIAISLIVTSTSPVMAHSGRTDSNGGHRDNKNKSGLGYYHYHCGGHPAHLHENGVCPYKSGSSSNNSSSSKSNTRTKMYLLPSLRLSGSEINIGLAIALREAGRK